MFTIPDDIRLAVAKDQRDEFRMGAEFFKFIHSTLPVESTENSSRFILYPLPFQILFFFEGFFNLGGGQESQESQQADEIARRRVSPETAR